MTVSFSLAPPTSRSRASRLVLASSLVLGAVAACTAAPSSPTSSHLGDGISASGDGALSGSASGTVDDGGHPTSGGPGETGPSTGSFGGGSDGSTATDAGPNDASSAFAHGDGASTTDARDLNDSGTVGDALKPPGCAGLFCEDFESGKIDPNVWNVKTSGGQTVVVESAMAAHGRYAAQFHALPNVLSYDLLITKNAPLGLRGHHFGRAYFYVTPTPPPQHTTMLFAASAGFPTFKRLEVSSIGTGLQLTSVNQTGIDSNSAALQGTIEKYSRAGGTLPVAQWDCLEWEFKDAPDEIRVFLNGSLDLAYTNIVLGGVSSGQVGGFVDFGFGYYAWHPATYTFDMFYDDIVLDTNRVGCLP